MTLFQRIASLFLIAFTAVPAIAQEALPLDFLIERIEVRGARFASPSVVENESLLEQGNRYSEAGLRDAMRRINRLPFVLDSSFELEKGTERGAYVLVITIVETKPLFFEAYSSRRAARHQGVSRNWTEDEGVRAGLRGFVGSRTLLHVAADDDRNYEAGLTLYSLFGHPGFVSLAVTWRDDPAPFGGGPGGEDYEIQFDAGEVYRLQLGIPVRGNHSIVARALTSESKTRFVSGGLETDESASSLLSEIAWHYDTTDDPILPAAGTIWRTGASFGDYETIFSFPAGGSLPETGVNRSDRDVYFTSVSRYRPVTDLLSLAYGGEVSVERFDTGFAGIGNYERSEIAPHAGFTASLWSDRLTRRLGDLRLESNVVLHFNGESAGFDQLDYHYLTVESALVQRNVWGTLRFTFRYDDSETF